VHPRIEYGKTAPGVRAALYGLEAYVHQAGLEPRLLELVKVRASLINGCAYCLDMHTKGPIARRNRTAFVRRERLA
jgi:AhpD family alkylhydroperoxidase